MNVKEFDRQFRARALPDKILPTGLSCCKCFDCGFVWLNIEVGLNAWAYCQCFEGKKKQDCAQFKLPRYDFEMGSLFKLNTFPVSAFTPDGFEGFQYCLDRKIRAFKKDLKLSESFWLQKS